MVLSDTEIKKQIEKGNIYIDEFSEERLNPHSYNLRLSNKLKIYTEEELDTRKENSFKEIEIPETGYLLQPGELYIGSTKEYIDIQPPYMATVNGRSSLGRLGITVHITAGYIDSGFKGTVTLEISVMKPTWIYSNMEVCQLNFDEVKGTIEKPYHGKYQGQIEPTMSRMYKDLDEDKGYH